MTRLKSQFWRNSEVTLCFFSLSQEGAQCVCPSPLWSYGSCVGQTSLLGRYCFNTLLGLSFSVHWCFLLGLVTKMAAKWVMLKSHRLLLLALCILYSFPTLWFTSVWTQIPVTVAYTPLLFWHIDLGFARVCIPKAGFCVWHSLITLRGTS